MIKDIVFDFGGVLTLLNTNEALSRFKALGVECPEEYINPYCQNGPFFKVENGDITAEEFCNILLFFMLKILFLSTMIGGGKIRSSNRARGHSNSDHPF